MLRTFHARAAFTAAAAGAAMVLGAGSALAVEEEAATAADRNLGTDLAGMIAREEVVTKAQDPVTIQAKLQELELAAAVGAENEAVVQGKI